jgi:hypothetical protein
MNGSSVKENWEFMILDGAPPVDPNMGLCSMAVGDIDDDGNHEIVIGGDGALLWYRPATLEKGIAAQGRYHVGITLEDIDGDGKLEVFAGTYAPEKKVFWLKPGKDINEPWEKHEVGSGLASHDIIFADVDNDGERELLANNANHEDPGLFIFKKPADVTKPWNKYPIFNNGNFLEGVVAGDLNGDGRLEVVHGPDYYLQPEDGPLSGPWTRKIYAPSFREMCRTALIDITGSGRPDIVTCDSEYMEGRLSWFENRLLENPDDPWIEHPVDNNLTYCHTLQVWHDEGGSVHVFVAEMARGGWNAPHNHTARLIEYISRDKGVSWEKKILSQGQGTHQAIITDIDKDGRPEIVGKGWREPSVHLWKKREKESPLNNFKHSFIDRDKPDPAVDILPVNIQGADGEDVVCGRWWYKNPGWERFEIPGIFQAVCSYDVDGDGKAEIIATKGDKFSSELVWLKSVDPVNGKWETYSIGTGIGDWPHGAVMAPVLPGKRSALITAYHSAYKEKKHFPEIFEVPDDPAASAWKKSTLAEIPYPEEMAVSDLNGSGTLDIVLGAHVLMNRGDGTYETVEIVKDFDAIRACTCDINGNGRPDIVLTEMEKEPLDWGPVLSRIAWFENPGTIDGRPWNMHVLDAVRYPHSLAVTDIDGDGEPEIICAEHRVQIPYRTRCRLLVYKKADPAGRTWYRYAIDDRFEHHCGARIINLGKGKKGIISHGWKDSLYVHLWKSDGI